ncbi:Hypothetical_protein [Hexamita inflata]|uniref:Hypothetical_protein n=1 Tax=Hexamita inflata TaxID=28002 RepID=A0AA86QLX8_9EUKA|nr:Hypothetical protein HINF_LOCUS45926 [Hexamita inflata]
MYNAQNQLFYFMLMESVKSFSNPLIPFQFGQKYSLLQQSASNTQILEDSLKPFGFKPVIKSAKQLLLTEPFAFKLNNTQIKSAYFNKVSSFLIQFVKGAFFAKGVHVDVEVEGTEDIIVRAVVYEGKVKLM